jgi:hypothetical protein
MPSEANSLAAPTVKTVPLGYAAFGTLLSIVARATNITVVSSILSIDDQALFFTLSGFLGFQLAFELGFCILFQTSASHEFAKLEWRNGQFVGDSVIVRRLGSLFRFGMLWLAGSGLLMTIIMLPTAVIFYSPKLGATHSHWFWIVAAGVCVQAIDIPLQGCVAFFTGMRDPHFQVRNATLVSLLASVGSIAAAMFGTGAFCLPLGIAIGHFGTITNLALFKRKIFQRLLSCSNDQTHVLIWVRELFPIQWRLGVAWLSGAFYYQLLPSSVLPHYGPELAARYGISNTICQASLSVANALVVASAPAMATLAANRSFRELDFFAIRLLGLSMIVLISFLSLLVFICLPGFLPERFANIVATRLLPIEQISFLACISICVHYSSAIGSYIRAHKYEPLMPLGVLSAAASTFWIINFIERFPFTFILAGLALINAFFSFFVLTALTIYLRRKRDRSMVQGCDTMK